MDWNTFNGIVSIASAMVLTRVVLNPGIDEGLVVKTGLITMIFSLFGTAYHVLTKSEDAEALVRTGAALAAGIFFVVLGVFLKTKRGSPWAVHGLGRK